MDQIPLYKALVEREELDAVACALQTGKLGMGSIVADFERALAIDPNFQPARDGLAQARAALRVKR